MKVRHADLSLLRLERDATFDGGFAPGVASAFRKRMQAIRSAMDARDLAQVRGNRFEKLKGNRSHQYSVRLNDQYRLILELEAVGDKKVVVIVGIEDYH